MSLGIKIHSVDGGGGDISLTDGKRYTLIEAEGINPPSASINTAVNANYNGAVYKNSRLQERNIVIEVAIEEPAEANRIYLYKQCPAGGRVRLRFTNGARDVYIYGYVESVEVGFFDKKETVQISVICPEPLFKQAQASVITFAGDTVTNYVNGGELARGAAFILTASGEVVNPRIQNLTTGDEMAFTLTMQSGDRLSVDTEQGERRVRLNSENAVGYLDIATSEWLTINVRTNRLRVTADTGAANLSCSVSAQDKYEGV